MKTTFTLFAWTFGMYISASILSNKGTEDPTVLAKSIFAGVCVTFLLLTIQQIVTWIYDGTYYGVDDDYYEEDEE